MKIQKQGCKYYEEEIIGNANGGFITEPTPACCTKYKNFIFGRECEFCEEELNVNSI